MSADRQPPELRDLVSIPRYLRPEPLPVHPVRGSSPSGEMLQHSFGEGWTVLVFLSTTCEGCTELWAAFSDPTRCAAGTDVATLVVARATESREAVAALSAGSGVVMSDGAWSDYRVEGGPFFVLVDGTDGRVLAEGVAWSVEQIAAAVEVARAGG